MDNSSHGLEFDARSQFSLPIGELSKNVIFGKNNSSSKHTDNRKKDILVLGERLSDGLDDSTVTAEIKDSVNCTKSRNKICLSLKSVQQFFCML